MNTKTESFFCFFFNGNYFVGSVTRNKEEDMDVLSRNYKEMKNALFDELTNFVHKQWMPNDERKKIAQNSTVRIVLLPDLPPRLSG